MKTPSLRLLKGFFILLCGVQLFFSSCSKESKQMDSGEELCKGKSGLAAKITGTAAPIEMCVQDDKLVNNVDIGVQTIYQNERYLITANLLENDAVYSITIGFKKCSSFPLSLIVTGNQAEAMMDSNSVWFFYEERELGGSSYTTISATGSFTLTFSNEEIATGTFHDIDIDIEDTSTHTYAGKRRIAEGFLAVTTDP